MHHSADTAPGTSASARRAFSLSGTLRTCTTTKPSAVAGPVSPVKRSESHSFRPDGARDEQRMGEIGPVVGRRGDVEVDAGGSPAGGVIGARAASSPHSATPCPSG